MSSGTETARAAETASCLMLIHAETPLHPGTGSALGAVDLPVARERHTAWPLIPGSSLKGVLRDRCCAALAGGDAMDKDLWAVFGPNKNNASEFGGSLAVTDARLLAFPVRSLRGLFAWVTCPGVLMRLKRDAAIAGDDSLGKAVGDVLTKCTVVSDEHAVTATAELHCQPATKGTGANLVLEEFDYIAKESECLSALGNRLEVTLGGGVGLGTKLVLVHDDAFTHYTRFATEVVARVGLDAATKTVRKGALFYEEFLPSATILYSVLMASAPPEKANATVQDACGVLGQVRQALAQSGGFVQIGGDATTGKGLCFAALMGGDQ